MVDIKTSCYAARLAAFSCPQKHWKVLIFRGALNRLNELETESKQTLRKKLVISEILSL